LALYKYLIDIDIDIDTCQGMLNVRPRALIHNISLDAMPQ